MDLEIVTLSEVSQRQIYHLYVDSKKKSLNKFIYKTETDSQTQKTNLWLPKGKDWAREEKIRKSDYHINIIKCKIDDQQRSTI